MMKTKRLKLTGIILAFVMLFASLGVFSITAFAADGTDINGTVNPLEPDSTTAVASITSGDGTVTYYETFDNAFAAWEDGTTLTLLAEAYLEWDRVIEITGKTVTLDLNGNYMYFATLNIGSSTDSAASLTICDSSGGGEICAYYEFTNVYGTLTLQGGKLTSFVTVHGGTFNMTGGEMGNNDADNYIFPYAVEIVSGIANISGGEICGTYYGINVGGGCLNISGSPTISAVNNTTDETGSAIGITSEEASVTISGTPTFSGVNGGYIFYFEKTVPITLNTQPADGTTWSVYMVTPGVFANPGEGVTLDASKFTTPNSGYSIKQNSDGNLLLCDCKTAKATVSNGDGKTHKTTCACGEVTIVASINCTGGEATCTSGPICEVCNGEYDEPLGHSTEAENDVIPNCHSAGYCSRCNSSYGEVDLNNHDETLGADAYTNGICTCGDYQPATLNGGNYVIANAGNLFWYAEQYNKGVITEGAVLTANITIPEGKVWTPITTYTAEFNGAGKTITGLNVQVSGDNQGFIGSLTGTVENLTIYGEITVTAKAAAVGLVGNLQTGGKVSGVTSYVNITINASEQCSYIGGIAGRLMGGTIEKSAYYGNIDIKANNVDQTGGIVGYVELSNGGTINNCGFYGNITTAYAGELSIGGIIGYSRSSKLTMTNCLCVGTITAANDNVITTLHTAFGVINETPKAISNLYYLTGSIPNAYKNSGSYSYTPNDGTITNVTKEQLASGEVAYLLGSAFGQTLEGDGADNYPVLGGTEVPSQRFVIVGQQLNIGEDLSLKYIVSAYGDGVSVDMLKMRFIFLGVVSVVTPEYDEDTGYYVFTLDGINPQCMGDTIDATLLLGGAEKASKNGYSVEQNLLNLLEDYPDDDELKTLVNDILAYGAAASAYKGYGSIGDYTGSNREIPETTVENTDNLYVVGVNVRFGTLNYIKLRILSNTEPSVSVGGNTLTVTEEDGYWVVVSQGISATDFGKEIVFNIEVGGSSSYYSYSVNAYLYAISQSSTASENMKALANALYNYGISAHLYTGEHSGGEATCTHGTLCDVCGTEYDTTLDATNHASTEFTHALNEADSTKHDKKYACCGDVAETVDHIFDENGKCVCGAETN